VAVATQVAFPTRTAGPIALWHLLSLDAPTVAALWTWFIARASRVGVPLISPLTMAIAVWILYAADRLLDARHLNAPRTPKPDIELEARHLFHHRHRRAFLVGIALASVALVALLPILDPSAIRLYLIEGGLLGAWFVILHATRSAHRLPKEIAVGLFFSAAVFIPTVARRPLLRPALLSSAILLAALCSLNCLFIYAWEHEDTCGLARALRNWRARPAHSTTRLALAHLPALAVIITITGAALALFHLASSSPVPIACALAALLLLGIHCNRGLFSRTNLRAAADLALLTPLLLLPFVR
jgi:hypothetical protein